MIRKIRNIAIAFIFLGIVWIIIRTTWDSLPKTAGVKDINAMPVGGVCGDKLYDNNGVGYENFGVLVEYSGPAPLYKVSYEVLGLIPDSMMCVDYPQQIDPAIAQTGQPVYPVILMADFETESLKAGESYPLRVSAVLSSYFPPYANWNAYITPDKVTDVTFTLDASNFEYSPSNEEARKVPFGYSSPAKYTWSIAPMERASGEQFLVVYVDSEEANLHAGAGISIDVRDTLGLKSSTLAYVMTISLVIGYLLSQTKTFVEIMGSLGILKVKKKE